MTMKNYFICIVCALLFMSIFGCGQNKLERDAEYYHNYGMNYEQYNNFMESQRQEWIKEYKSSDTYFPKRKKSTK